MSATDSGPAEPATPAGPESHVAAPVAMVELVRTARVIVCCGTGGVGKTTTSAAIALEAARRGRNVVVITIDPARRLADTLGIEAIGNTPTEISRSRWDPAREYEPGGRLSALMLDPKATFDGLVRRYAADDAQAERILENRFYRNISGVLGGTQEYMAMEKLHELVDAGTFNLIVVDTPPTRHALDFLDAPNRLIKLLDNRVFHLVMMPTRASVKFAGSAVQAFFRRVARVAGTAVIDDVVAFFRAFDGMETGFRARANEVREILAAPDTTFVIVTSPRPDAIAESEFFATTITDKGLHIGALIANRVHPEYTGSPVVELRVHAAALAGAERRESDRELAALLDNLIELRTLAARERSTLRDAHEALGVESVFVPFLARDVHDFSGLHAIGRALMAPQSSGDDDAHAASGSTETTS